MKQSGNALFLPHLCFILSGKTKGLSMKQSGNALFLILIAVALFAALSYAVTQSGRGGGSIDREKASLSAAQAMQYAGQIGQAVQKMQLLSGCTDEQISFWNDSDGNGTENGSDDYFNAGSPTDRSCHVFQSEGGAVISQGVDGAINDGSDWIFIAENRTWTSSEVGLMMILPNITEAACVQINSQLGIDTPLPDPDGFIVNVPFTGSYNNNALLANDDYTSCIRSDGALGGSVIGNYYLYHKLIER